MPLHLEQHRATAALAAAVVFVVCAEWARGGTTNGASPAWLTLEAAAAGGALLVAWRYQDGLRLVPLLALTAGYGARDRARPPGGRDTRRHGSEGVRRAGQPTARRRLSPFRVSRSAQCSCSVSTRCSAVTTCVRRTALLMIPFQVLTVGAVWALRTRWSGWLAALLAVWPASLFFVHLRFDAVVAAFLVTGLVLASPRAVGARGRGAGRRRGGQVVTGTRVRGAAALAGRLSPRLVPHCTTALRSSSRSWRSTCRSSSGTPPTWWPPIRRSRRAGSSLSRCPSFRSACWVSRR